jgi:dTDP-D-glucose 4,6-dehydratase
MYENVLVTGGCGFIASNFLNMTKERYPQTNFVNIDKLDYCSNVENVKPGVATFVKGNVGNKELVEHLIKKYAFDAISRG